MAQQKRYPGQRLGDEKGLVLVVSLMMGAVIMLLGTTAVLTTSTDLKISGNYRTGNEAFYIAEAGIEEARARLRAGAASPITDTHPTQASWAAFIGSETKANGKGYNSGNTMNARYASLSTMDYTVKIVHATNAGGNLLYWYDPTGGDKPVITPTPVAGKNIYRVTGYGGAANATKVIEVEMAPLPPISVPGALYVKAPTNIIGNAHVLGVKETPPGSGVYTDPCAGRTGAAGLGAPAITTVLPLSSVDCSNNSTVTGTNSPTGDPKSVAPNGPDMNVNAMINNLKGKANYSYHVSGTQTGMSWGTPTLGATQQDPSSCSANNVVYYDTRDGGGNPTSLRLAGGTTGCGLLIVDGDLEVSGGFSWYGVVLVRGSVTYTGGGGKNVTGGMVTGGSVIADVVGGDSNIVYCSSAVNNLMAGSPLQRLSWMEKI
jgi:Tfp pilus assembly protein PilX